MGTFFGGERPRSASKNVPFLFSQEGFFMSTNLFIQRAVRCALCSGAITALTVSLPAQAQQQSPGQETQSIQEVVVTGSRIAQPNLTSVSPVTAVSSDQIKIEGVTRTEDLINNLPQAFADFGGNVSNG